MGDRYFKAPAAVVPRPPRTGLVNPGCYLSSTGDCSNDLSREHFFSESILDELSMGARQVWVAGMHWMADGVPNRVDTNGISARVLCGRHNNALQPLDTAAIGFFRTLDAIRPTRDQEPNHVHRLFSGHDIERWLLKLLIGFAASGLARDERGRRVKAVKPPIELVRALLAPDYWPGGFGRMAYCPRPAARLNSQAACCLELAVAGPRVLVGLRVVLLDAVLLIGTTPTTFTARVVTRPLALVTTGGSRVELSWLDWKEGGPANEVWWPAAK